MVFRIGKLLERGRTNQKGLISILEDHEKRLDALESANNASDTDSDSESIGSDDEPTP